MGDPVFEEKATAMNSNRKPGIKDRLYFLLTMSLAVFGAIFISVAVEKEAGYVEGKLLPVITLAEIAKTEPVSDFRTRVWLTSTKIRECEFLSVEWRLGQVQDDITLKVPVQFEGNPVIRRPGEQNIGPWIVNMSEDLLINNSHAYVIHKCHLFWDTKTPFYDSSVIVPE